jgi:ferrochelatase
VKLAVILFNLGGPVSLEGVEPFLRNLFSDPAVIDLPGFLRRPLARIVARKRAPVAREIYARIGGRSPILEETWRQADTLEAVLAARGFEARSFVAMRCAEPFSSDVARAVKAWGAERIVLVPLYPQFSTTTTGSSIADWLGAATKAGLNGAPAIVCCFPTDVGFVGAHAELIHQTLTRRRLDVDYRLLLSAHGLPKRTIAKGDPYRWQVEQTAAAIVDRLGIKDLDWQICFQSRVGPLEWIGPSTDNEIRRAGAQGRGVIVVPIAFVSEHSETLVELDLDYAKLAKESGVPDYLRVPALGTHAKFIKGLGDIVVRALEKGGVVCGSDRACPDAFRFCGQREGWA